MSSSAAKTPCIDLDEDLEDGEIDDDDDEVVVQQSLPLQQQQQQQQQQKQPKSGDEDVQFVGIESLNQNIDKSKDDDVVFLGQSGEGSNNTIKTKKPLPVEDDHAVSIENAIANALKKRGIEPPMPKMRSMHNNSSSPSGREPNDVGGGGVGVGGGNGGGGGVGANIGDDGLESGQYPQQQAASRNSRRRKRKKERERKQKKDKDHQKRARHDDEEETASGAAAGGAASDEMDMDEYEMMNVRGGSPPPGGAAVPAVPFMGGDNGPGAGGYDSLQDYYSSYDSYSDDDMVGGMNQRRRQRHDRDKDNQRGGNSGRKRRDRDQDRRHDTGSGNATGGAGSNKRNRRDSGDGTMNNDKMMRTEPRKLELCKFYLMDCCAKRDKCSYMHKEFPCKYYYLGMDCYAGEDCLFHHGEPLSEQLRNILLKHMETAPKEILGDFKRIGRDVALGQMTRRHEQLCEQYGRENSWTTLASAGISRRRPGEQGQQQQLQQDQQQQQQQQQQLQQQHLLQQQQLSTSPLGGSSLEGVANQLNNTAAGQQLQQQLAGGQIIPSLLDMVINRPQINESKTEKKRKSRWAEKTAAKAAAAAGAATTTTAAASSTTTRSTNPVADVTGSSNLPPVTTTAAAATGSKSLPPHLDLVNLTNVLSAEHMAKLNKLGITNLEQMLEVPFGQLTEVGLTLHEIGEIQQKAEAAKPTESKATATTTSNSGSSINPPAKSETTEANSNSNSNGFIMVDYTQYLKDAHVNFSANDPLDDDRDDDEQLVIDDGNDESAAEEEPKVKSTKQEQIDNEAPPLPSVFDLPSFMSNMIGGGGTNKTPSTPEHQAETANDNKKANKEGDDGTGGAPSTSSSLFSRILFGEKQPDPEARAAFYRDIIRNPFKAHQGDIGDDQPNENSNSNSRSMTPTPTPTPEPGSQSPKPMDEMSLPALEPPTFKSGGTQQSSPLYSRASMYDFDSTKAEQQLAALQKANDQVSSSERDIDMRLPFEPMKHYMPATEIDAAIFSHTPLRWQLQEVDVEEPNYVQLRLSAAHKEQRELRDPRVRRILGLTELTADNSCGSGASGGGGANLLTNSDSVGRFSGNTISSPDSVIMSPMARDTTPTSPPPLSSSLATTSSSAASQVLSSSTKLVLPAMNVPPPTMGIPPPNVPPVVAEPQVRTDPRRDPRRAHLNASSNTANTSNSSSNSSSSTNSSTSQSNPSGGSKQILEIRNLMQSSNWYKNLGSNNKILVNQQLALVFTELKKFHQQEGNNKIFDLNFVVNNSTLQQIFAKLYIYIDDMGQVVQLPEDLPTQGMSSGAAASSLILPNLSQPPPNMVQMLRQPPPNICGNAPGGGLMMQMGMPPPTVVFNQPPPSRPRLLGMGPGGGNGGGGGGGGMPLGNNNNNLFNPFSGGGGGNGGNMGMPFMNNGGGGMPYKNFNNNGGGPGGNGGGGHHHFSGGGNNRNQRGNGPRNRNNI
ncbi:LOW QUALITY PROTEIN: protein suppressor of sable [Drosophila tropicalis]|uniref:LOW QUALITY PROTEIN: protein suppressor of sable n=1 Tax=Drosophila tropicalis TaxID=46794 RepID=UPI0035ABA1CB